jgi:sec-independent protein translocase protein TatB
LPFLIPAKRLLLLFPRGSMMKRMSFSETIFLFFLALVIFGPKKLPEIARQIGKALNEFRRASNEFKAQIEQEISNLEVEKRQTILPPSHPPEGVASRALYSAPGQSTSAEAPATLASSTDEPIASVAGPLPVATEAVAPAADSTSAPLADPSLVTSASVPSSPVSSSSVSSPSVDAAQDLTAPTAQESHV